MDKPFIAAGHEKEWYGVREDAQLLTQAKAVFGDLAKRAFFAEFNQTKADMLEHRLRALKENQTDESVLHIDEATVVIEFSNGNNVLFTSSEWGHMQLLKDFDQFQRI